MNYRNQSLDFIKKNADLHKKFENRFKTHIQTKYDIELVSEVDIYSHYDFSYENMIIEYKGVKYKLNDDRTIAIKEKTLKEITNVMIGIDKIDYFLKVKKKNSLLRFVLFYGFYDIIDNNIKSICYRCIEITDILSNIDNIFKSFVWLNKKHYLIPIKDLKGISKDIFHSSSMITSSSNLIEDTSR